MRLLLLITALMTLAACSQEPSKPVTIAINPWPGYEPLYLAEFKGFFKAQKLDIKLVQLASLSDVQLAYSNRHVDGMASTAVEAVQVNFLGSKPNKIVLVPDYSNGGDVIIAGKQVVSMSDLKGKKVGAEVTSLGIFLLERALGKHHMSLTDVEVVNIDQAEAKASLESGAIDALVTYPPFSIQIAASDDYRTIFTSAEIPKEIIDVVSLSEETIQKHPGLVAKLHKAWQMALDYMRDNPEDAYQIMAQREGISAAEFEASLTDLIFLDSQEQRALLSADSRLQSSMQAVCTTLVAVRSIEGPCSKLPNLIYPVAK